MGMFELHAARRALLVALRHAGIDGPEWSVAATYYEVQIDRFNFADAYVTVRLNDSDTDRYTLRLWERQGAEWTVGVGPTRHFDPAVIAEQTKTLLEGCETSG